VLSLGPDILCRSSQSKYLLSPSTQRFNTVANRRLTLPEKGIFFKLPKARDEQGDVVQKAVYARQKAANDKETSDVRRSRALKERLTKWALRLEEHPARRDSKQPPGRMEPFCPRPWRR